MTGNVAAPKFLPTPPTEQARAYRSPDHVPESWTAERPGELAGFQPRGPLLGSQGPDQGFALKVAERLRDKLELQANENADDAIRGCLGVALRRASLYSRAPVVHDLTIAFTVWGFYDPSRRSTRATGASYSASEPGVRREATAHQSCRGTFLVAASGKSEQGCRASTGARLGE